VTARLAGQVAVVTGGALGIGGGISRRLAAAGAHVVVADIDADAGAATRDEIVGPVEPARPSSAISATAMWWPR
jgi:NAD(P)-dependent dehydrogenase (short-subunit alcohol dehydrogenase family)